MLWLLLLSHCLLQVSTIGAQEQAQAKPEVRIENGTLKAIYGTADLTHLNLSSLGIKKIEENAFSSVKSLRSLDLSNNSIIDLPLRVFSNLTDLEYLSLSGNNLRGISHRLATLNVLKVLDLTQQWNLTILPSIDSRDQVFAGLPDDTEITTSAGLSLAKLRPTMFNVNQSMQIGWRKDLNIKCPNTSIFEMLHLPLNRINQSVTICLSDNIVDAVEIESENLVNCKSLGVLGKSLELNQTGIAGFKRNWYRLLESYHLSQLILDDNEIQEINEGLLNDLPKNILFVSLKGNKIKQVQNDMLNNNHLKYLKLRSNKIELIENRAFENLKSLKSLDVKQNKLCHLQFLASLPNTIEILQLAENEIQTIPNDSFTRFTNLYLLDLSKNKIAEINDNTFKGLRNLNTLDLNVNKLTKLNKGLFDDLVCAEYVYLNFNEIESLENGFARKLNNLLGLDLYFNLRVRKLTNGVFYGLPLDSVVYSGFFIESIKPGIFKHYN